MLVCICKVKTKMSEISQSQIQDPVLAEHMAYAEKPYQELASQARAMGVGHVADEMATHANNASYWVAQEATVQTTEQADPANTVEQEASAELGREEIKNILEYSAASAHLSLHSSNDNINIKGIENMSGLNTLTHNTDKRSFIGKLPANVQQASEDEWPTESFTESGVPEIITVNTYDNKFVGNSHPKAGEKLSVLVYQTDSAKNGKYQQQYRDDRGRPGCIFSAAIAMPESDAIRIIEATKDKPETIHDVMDVYMRDILGAQEGWDKSKPPYDAWKEMNEGVGRIAIRTDAHHGPEQSDIVEY